MKSKLKKRQQTRTITKVIPLYPSFSKGLNDGRKLINCVLYTAHSSLWPSTHFSDHEQNQHKRLLVEYFQNGNSTRKAEDIIQCICLAKRYVSRRRGRYISKPQDWLNIHYPNGLSGTISWLKRVNEVRNEVPDYNKGIKVLAKALLSFSSQPTKENFEKHKLRLIANRQFDLLQVFSSVALQIQFEK